MTAVRSKIKPTIETLMRQRKKLTHRNNSKVNNPKRT